MTKKQQEIIDWLTIEHKVAIQVTLYNDHTNPNRAVGYATIRTALQWRSLLRLVADAKRRGYELNYDTDRDRGISILLY